MAKDKVERAMSAILMHGMNWTGQDVAGWWLSEKLDGFRCLWTGEKFLSREGMEFPVPDWFCIGMPKMAIDGELWAGRGGLHHLQSNCLKSGGDWSPVRFCPFDVPEQSMKIENAIARLNVPLPPHVQPVSYHRVISTQEAIETMRNLTEAGAEGVMLRKPGSGYNAMHRCRSEKLLKLKPWMV